ncbi:MAG: prolipoprotein diacylglyceryl transferase [Candidatus Omnitrophica bacterium]|nr:prolipoprotein diacylglyceryl transferase [Candidatus Omnitrophota bacterium]
MHRILFQIGPVTLYSYGFMIAVGFVLSTVLILGEARKEGLPGESVFDAMIAVLAGGMIGGRLLFVAINAEYYFRHPVRVLFFNEGGMAIQGALAGALIGGLLVCRLKRLPFWRTSDVVAPYAALGQAIGRIGCFFNGCCYGYPYSGPCAVLFPGDPVPRFPSQLLYSGALLMLFVVLLAVKREKPFQGFVFISYLVLYGTLRFSLDFLRGDALMTLDGLTLSQALGLAITAAGIVLWVVRRSRK